MSASDPSFCLIGQTFILNLNYHMEFGCIMITAVFSCIWNLSECLLDVVHVQKGKTRTLEAGEM